MYSILYSREFYLPARMGPRWGAVEIIANMICVWASPLLTVQRYCVGLQVKHSTIISIWD